MNRKQLQKLKKSIYEKINIEVLPLEDSLIKLSPFYPIASGSEAEGDFFKRFNTLFANSIQKYKNKGVLKDFWIKDHKQYVDYIITLIKTERAIEYGIDDIEGRRNEALEYINRKLCCFNTEVRYEFLKELQQMELLTKISMTRLKHTNYYQNEELKGEAGLKLSKLCFENVEYGTIVDMLDEDIEKFSKVSDPTIKEHFTRTDAEKIRELLIAGKPFYVYRGFVVDENEYVRAGKKVDGDDYYKQNAGIGISYSIDRDVALYFCYYGLSFNEDGTDNEYTKSHITDRLPDSLTTRQDRINKDRDLISMRRNALKKKPILCKFLVEPEQIAGTHTKRSEAELNILPEDLKVIDYKIATSIEIAEALNNYTTKSWDDLNDVPYLYRANGVVITTFIENGRKYYVYADADDVNEKANAIRNKMLNGEIVDWHTEMKNIYLDNALQLPKDIEPLKTTPRWLEWLMRKPERMLRSKGQKYLAAN